MGNGAGSSPDEVPSIRPAQDPDDSDYDADEDPEDGFINIAQAQDPGRLQGPGVAEVWPATTYPTIAQYSPELQLLAKRCLEWDPRHRPTLREAYVEVETHLTQNPAMLGNGDMGPLTFSERSFLIGMPFPTRRRRPHI
jgi:hypothetical protein